MEGKQRKIGYPSSPCLERDLSNDDSYLPSDIFPNVLSGVGKMPSKKENDSARVNVVVGKGPKPPAVPSIFEVPSTEHASPSGLVQCCIIRSDSRYTLTFQPGFGLAHQRPPAMIAEKQGGNLTSNYHIFDATRAGTEAKLTKKAGHYIGKVRRDRPSGGLIPTVSSGASYSLYDSKEEREQIAAFVYEVPSLLSQWKEGQPPRKLRAFVPREDGGGGGGAPPGRLPSNWAELSKAEGSIVGEEIELPFHVLVTKEPSYENGQYRLNFSGRVSTPSVKNFQLEGCDKDGIVVQFGRVGDDRFHLDYRAPFNAFQAFSLALTQFDL